MFLYITLYVWLILHVFISILHYRSLLESLKSLRLSYTSNFYYWLLQHNLYIQSWLLLYSAISTVVVLYCYVLFAYFTDDCLYCYQAAASTVHIMLLWCLSPTILYLQHCQSLFVCFITALLSLYNLSPYVECSVIQVKNCKVLRDMFFISKKSASH